MLVPDLYAYAIFKATETTAIVDEMMCLVNLDPFDQKGQIVTLVVEIKDVLARARIRADFDQLPAPFILNFGFAPGQNVIHDSILLGYRHRVPETVLISGLC